MLSHIFLILKQRHINLNSFFRSEFEIINKFTSKYISHVSNSFLFIFQHIPAKSNQLYLHFTFTKLILHIRQHKATQMQYFHIYSIIQSRFFLIIQYFYNFAEFLHHHFIYDLTALTIFEGM